MESDLQQLSALLPSISTQLRGALSNFHLAATQLVSPAQREQDPALDARAALLDQSYYQLLRIVNNLRDAELLGRNTPFSLRDADVAALIREACSRVEALARLRQLELRFVCQEERLVCAVSARHLELLLDQLLSNALKFTPPGGCITVDLRSAAGQVLLSVTDTGCGIESDRLPTLFDRFLHDELLDPPPHGLGLGLPLCRCVAEGHGGSMMAESKPGRGTRITLSIPERQVGAVSLSDVPDGYPGGGFNAALLALADALPPEAFLIRNQ